MMLKRVVSSVLAAVTGLTAFSVYAAPSCVDEKLSRILCDFGSESLADINAVFTARASLEEDTEKNGKVLHLDGTAEAYMEVVAPKDESRGYNAYFDD